MQEDNEYTDKIKQMNKSICKIDNENSTGTGFLCLIPFPDSLSLLRVLITCNHVFNDINIILHGTVIPADNYAEDIGGAHILGKIL